MPLPVLETLPWELSGTEAVVAASARPKSLSRSKGRLPLSESRLQFHSRVVGVVAVAADEATLEKEESVLGLRVVFERERTNQADRNAIAAEFQMYGKRMKGYLPRQLAAILAVLQDRGVVAEVKGVIQNSEEEMREEARNFQGEKLQMSVEAVLQIRCQARECCKGDEAAMMDALLEYARRNRNSDQVYANRNLDHFRNVISCSLQAHDHLFTKEEKEFVRLFICDEISPDAQRLYARLFLRQNKWIHIDSVKYDEISTLDSLIIDELCSKDLIQTGKSILDHKQDFLTFLTSLSRPKLVQLRSVLDGISTKSTSHRHKSDILASLEEILFKQLSISGKPLFETLVFQKAFKGQIDPEKYIKVNPQTREIFARLWKLFSMEFQCVDLPQTSMLYSMGMVKYYPYKLSSSMDGRIFPSRKAFAEYLEMSRTASEIITAYESGLHDVAHDISEPVFVKMISETQTRLEETDLFLVNFSLDALMIECVRTGVKSTEKLKLFEQAKCRYETLIQFSTKRSDLGEFTKRHRGMWWDRLIMIVEKHLKNPEEAYNFLLSALKNDSKAIDGASIQSINRRKLRLHKRLKLECTSSSSDSSKAEVFNTLNIAAIKCTEIFGRSIISRSGQKSLYYNESNEICTVEEIALEFYTLKKGWSGYHCEGSVFRSLFGILFWEALWDDSISHVFQTPFQSYPLDLTTHAFYERRKEKLENILSKMMDSNGMEYVENIILDRFEHHFGVQCIGVNWSNWTAIELINVVKCFGTQSIAVILRQLAKDWSRYRGGMPDLCLLRINPTFDGLLVEVKSERDRLMDNQRAWIEVLMSNNIKFEICHVISEAGS